MKTRTAKRKCPKCTGIMIHELPDDEFFDLAVRLFKLSWCSNCWYFEEKLEKLENLKRAAWIEINRREEKRAKLKSAVKKGWIEPNASYDIAKMDREAQELRDNLKKLEFKTQEITLSYGRHIEKTKKESRT